jgi:hypothetical protein
MHTGVTPDSYLIIMSGHKITSSQVQFYMKYKKGETTLIFVFAAVCLTAIFLCDILSKDEVRRKPGLFFNIREGIGEIWPLLAACLHTLVILKLNEIQYDQEHTIRYI